MALPRQRSALDPQVGKNLKTFNSFRVRLLGLQGLGQVLLHVLHVLEPDRDPQQPLGDAELGPIRRRDALVGGGRRMGDQRLGVAQVVGDVD